MNIESVQDVLGALIESEWNFMYRGQARSWPLLPSIGRHPEIVQGYEHWSSFHDDIIYRFLRLGHPYLGGQSTKGTDAWVLAQHHGLPTRLLDTTTNPLKALFFAVNSTSEDAHDGVFWIFSYKSWREELTEESRPFWDKELVPFLPAQLDARLTAQEGSFISYPLPQNSEPLTPMEDLHQHEVRLSKHVVPSESKPRLRRELALLGIQFRFLFPDLDGVARTIRLKYLDS